MHANYLLTCKMETSFEIESFFLEGVGLSVCCTAWCSEIGFLRSLNAPERRASSDVREPISLHQSVFDCGILCPLSMLEIALFWNHISNAMHGLLFG